MSIWKYIKSYSAFKHLVWEESSQDTLKKMHVTMPFSYLFSILSVNIMYICLYVQRRIYMHSARSYFCEEEGEWIEFSSAFYSECLLYYK